MAARFWPSPTSAVKACACPSCSVTVDGVTATDTVPCGVGGVLGGIFNSIVAPLVFKTALEYKVVLALAAFMIPKLISPDDEAAARKAAEMEVRSMTGAGSTGT